LVDDWRSETSDTDFITQCMFQAIAPSFSSHSVAKGGNVLGLDKEKDNAVMLLYNIAVKSADLEVLARKKLRASGEAMRKFAADMGGLVDWTYLNYADGYQVRRFRRENAFLTFPKDPLGSYGAENVAKIRAAARKYDPDQVFQTRFPGGFKISKVEEDGRKTEL
jgi:hypothetical protein